MEKKTKETLADIIGTVVLILIATFVFGTLVEKLISIEWYTEIWVLGFFGYPIYTWVHKGYLKLTGTWFG